jgi:hypothetical protein
LRTDQSEHQQEVGYVEINYKNRIVRRHFFKNYTDLKGLLQLGRDGGRCAKRAKGVESSEYHKTWLCRDYRAFQDASAKVWGRLYIRENDYVKVHFQKENSVRVASLVQKHIL